jgi:serine phosphatase RsbU (regulator of sigma subunit)
MPSRGDWIELLRGTFSAVGREEITGLYSQEWRRAQDVLTAEDRDVEARRGGRMRRFFRTTNSVLFGLARRLAPARRVVFLAVLLCLLMSVCAPEFQRSDTRVENGERHTTHYTVDFGGGFLLASTVLLGLLLGMELVDKINYRDELELARDLQASLIPKTLPETPVFTIGAHNEIANTVGGDIYDFVPLPGGGLAVLFGDASGHGMAAGLIMAVAHAAFRTQLEVDPSPPAMFATLNRILCRTGSPRAFFSCVYLLVSDDGAFRGSVAGHPQPLLLGADGGVRARIGKGAYPLGIRPQLIWAVESGRIEEGETLFLYSDGLPEARNELDQEFGESRIEGLVRAGVSLPPQALADSIAASLHAFRGRTLPDDDVSIAAIRRTRGQP